MELAAARQEGFVSKHLSETNRTPKKRQVVVIGILTGFARRNQRDAIRQAWMGTGIFALLMFYYFVFSILEFNPMEVASHL